MAENKFFISERHYDADGGLNKFGWSEWTKYSDACLRHSNYSPIWHRIFQTKKEAMKILKELKKMDKMSECAYHDYKVLEVPEDKNKW